MKRGIIAAIVIAFLIVTSTFLLTSPLMPKARSVENRSGTTPVSTDVTPSNAVDPQIYASQSTVQSSEASVPGMEQNEQALTQDQSTIVTQAEPNQTTQPPVPFPDGRIFLRATSGADDAIPYIPTQYTKPTTPPIIPSESDM
jgi:hypothetical protein